jgi:hypothetical protein
MSDRISEDDKKDSKVPAWLNTGEDKEQKEEKVVKHTPSREKKPGWAYTTKEGGEVRKLDFPTTKEKIQEVEQQLTNPRNWRKYKRHPQGGHRNYTQVNCFPPFDFLRLAELYLPDGRVWKSRTRQFHEQEN